MHDDVLRFLLALAVLLGGARLVGELARRFRLPAVVGEIVAGLVVGRTVLGRVSPATFEWLFSSGGPRLLVGGYTAVAVVLLMVVAGLEIDLNVVRRSSKTVLFTSALGVAVPFVLGYGVGLLLPAEEIGRAGPRELHAAFLGIALSISALPVITRTLLDLGLLKTGVGLVVISSAVFDDLIGWTAFSVLSRELEAEHGGAGRVVLSATLTVLFVVVTLLVVRPVADRLLDRIQRQREASSGRVLSFVMVLALLGAAATEALGMHAVFGGFVMGLAIGDSPRLREHTRRVLSEFVTSVFTPVFFATMALRVDFLASFDPVLTLVVVAIAFVAKVAGCSVGARLGGIAWREAAAIGFGMNSRGAMEILLAGLALEARIIETKMFVALVVMAVVTSLSSGPAMMALVRRPAGPILTLVRAGAVLLDLEVTDRAGAIRGAALALAEKLGRPEDADRFFAALWSREEVSGTGVGEGVAIPHAEIEGLRSPALALVRTKQPLDFDAPDGFPVRLVFVLLTPARQFESELRILSAIAKIVMDEHVRRALLEAETEREVFDTLAAVETAPTKAKPASPSPPDQRA